MRPSFRSLAPTLAGAVALGGALAPATVHAGSWQERDVGSVHVHVYVPDTEPIHDERSLLVLLHGCAQTAQDLRELGSFEGVAEAHGAIIMLPEVPNGGVLAGCWDYYGPDHDRDSGHAGAVLDTVDWALDEPFDIDPAQVAIGGLSSGGGMSGILGCLAPDVFAGVGLLAAPAVGTNAAQIAVVSTTAELAREQCLGLAAGATPSFSTQFAIVATDSSDFTVAQGYAELNAEVARDIYEDFDVVLVPQDLPLDAFGGDGQARRFDDANHRRILWWRSNGVGHRWPTATGAPNSNFVSGLGPNFADVLATTLTLDNPRIEPDDPDPGGETGGVGETEGGETAETGDVGDSGGGDSAEDSGGEDSASESEGDAGTPGGGANDGPTGCACQAPQPGRPRGVVPLIWSILFLRTRLRGSGRSRPRSRNSRDSSAATRPRRTTLRPAASRGDRARSRT